MSPSNTHPRQAEILQNNFKLHMKRSKEYPMAYRSAELKAALDCAAQYKRITNEQPEGYADLFKKG